MYVYQQAAWPNFIWDLEIVSPLLAAVRYKQGMLVGRMQGLGFELQEQTTLRTITEDVLKTSEIEGELLEFDQVRSSIARQLGMDIGALAPTDRHVDGIVNMLLDATQRHEEILLAERLFDWHGGLFPTGRNAFGKITVGAWREDLRGPMQVVSGAFGREKVHFEAPAATLVPDEMAEFIAWFNAELGMDPILKAAVCHLWFITIHPFSDGNGRIARAVTDMQLARAEQSKQRFYSMSARIQFQRKAYYSILESTQKGGLDITAWIVWFLSCLDGALADAEQTLDRVLYKASFWTMLYERNVNLNERQRHMLNKLFDGFDGKLNTSKWAKITKVSKDTALRDIQSLEEQGILTKEEGGGRSTSYALILLEGGCSADSR